jgi:hypothetical protein
MLHFHLPYFHQAVTETTRQQGGSINSIFPHFLQAETETEQGAGARQDTKEAGQGSRWA